MPGPVTSICRDRRRSNLPDGNGRNRNGQRREGQHPGRGRPAREAPGLRDDPRGPGPERGHRALRTRGAAAPARARVRRHPARRQHARHGRLRDGRHDPQPPADGPHADHLRHGLQRRDAHRPGLLARARSITSSRPSSPRSCGPRSASSSTCTRRRSRSSGRPRSASPWRGSRRRGPRPRRRTAARRSSPRRAPSWSARSTMQAIPRGLARQAVPFLGDLCAVTLDRSRTTPSHGGPSWPGSTRPTAPCRQAHAASPIRRSAALSES